MKKWRNGKSFGMENHLEDAT